ncbi:MAG: class II aldolase/adducin family protein, partial [Rubrobacteraceae bacterium]
MDVKLAGAVDSLWDSGEAKGLLPLETLAYRSNLLGTDRSVANYGGGNTSTKTTEIDHTGREIRAMWVKGSGSDLSTIQAEGFTGLKLDEILPLMDRDEMSDEEMVTYLAKCQLDPAMPRSSIETLLHAFVPYPHVDHTHADAVNMICASENGEELVHECFGDEAVWIPYIRPGFTLSKQVGEAAKNNSDVKLVLLAKHGLVNWGETAEECYNNTIEIINRAAEFVAGKSAGKEPFGGQGVAPLPDDRREDLLAAVLPALRGAVSGTSSKILRVDVSDDVMEFVCGAESPKLSQVGAACPDHLVQTKVRPLWI